MECSTIARRPAVAAPIPATLLVARIGGVRHLITAQSIEAGTTALMLEGALQAAPNRYSVQVGVGLHLAPWPGLDPDDDACAWRYLNHSCDPNAAIVFEGGERRAEGMPQARLVATRSIARGAEVTFNYDTTEWDMQSPFRCACSRCAADPQTARLVRGYRHLTTQERRRLVPHVAPHLVVHARAEDATTTSGSDLAPGTRGV